jgi:Lrp/AsnC family transcriptional regulator, regulator for asnA, asnC and gidA
MASIADIDELDLKILTVLLDNARMPYTDVANKVHTSSGTVHVRMKKLESLGVVEGAQLLISPAKIGYDVCAFLGIYLEKGSLYKQVIQELSAIPEVVEAHYTTGAYSILVKIICRDTQHLRHVLNDSIQAIEGIERTETFISLEVSIQRPTPLAGITTRHS